MAPSNSKNGGGKRKKSDPEKEKPEFILKPKELEPTEKLDERKTYLWGRWDINIKIQFYFQENANFSVKTLWHKII